ncbi:MAG TPA: metallophosphoesterase [Burkholderiaceae bacterium]|nr:metallophosphoesterase [Burkholderiaceae bacterium]
MRLQIVSDVHLSHGDLKLPETDADLLILAGDIDEPEKAIEWASRLGKPILYVMGNHEPYGSTIRKSHETFRQLAAAKKQAGVDIRLLDQEALTLNGVRFLGATLWTDFTLYGWGVERDEAIAMANKLSPDFKNIKSDVDPQRFFNADDHVQLFDQHKTWLVEALNTPFDGPTVVITHHAPSPQSIHSRFANSPVNPAFINNLEHLMSADKVVLWVHGHTHNSFDYNVNGTRVVCNPRGYLDDNGTAENPEFDPSFVVEV